MKKLTPKAVIFDLGSTLIEYPSTTWEEISAEAVTNARDALVADGLELPPREQFYAAYFDIRQEYRDTAAQTLVEWTVPQVTQRLLEQVGVKPDSVLVERFFDAYYEKVRPHIYPSDGVADTLRSVRARIGRIGLVSNTVFPERAHLGELERFGLLPYFDFTVFSSTFGMRKPHPDIFYHAANLAGYAPAECVYIGDRYEEDVCGPSRIGMPAILRWHSQRDYPAEMPLAERRIQSLAELGHHLEL